MSNAVRGIAAAAALLGFSAVVMAALGSHAIDMQGQARLVDIWQKASTLHLFNAAALLGMAALLNTTTSALLKWAAWLLLAGTLLFCGSLYLHVIIGSQTAGWAPTGGMLMMAAWLLAALAFVRKP